jgi:hypothetical protein
MVVSVRTVAVPPFVVRRGADVDEEDVAVTFDGERPSVGDTAVVRAWADCVGGTAGAEVGGSVSMVAAATPQAARSTAEKARRSARGRRLPTGG